MISAGYCHMTGSGREYAGNLSAINPMASNIFIRIELTSGIVHANSSCGVFLRAARHFLCAAGHWSPKLHVAALLEPMMPACARSLMLVVATTATTCMYIYVLGIATDKKGSLRSFVRV